jgi:hypothetical protein
MGCRLNYFKAIVLVDLSFVDDNIVLDFAGIPSVDAFDFEGSLECLKGIGVDGGLVGGFNHASDIFATVAN